MKLRCSKITKTSSSSLSLKISLPHNSHHYPSRPTKPTVKSVFSPIHHPSPQPQPTYHKMKMPLPLISSSLLTDLTNVPHVDNDATKFAFGLFGTINQASGQIVSSDSGGTGCRVNGSRFVFDDYNSIINYDRFDRVVEQLWNTQIKHHTPASHFFSSLGTRIQPKDSFCTRFGSSTQISKALVKQFEEITCNKSQKECLECLNLHVKGYFDEFDKKVAMLIGKSKKKKPDVSK